MVGEIDFGALKTPDYFGNALKYRQAGREQGGMDRGGAAIGAGDFDTAAREYGAAGLQQEALSARKYGTEVATTRARKEAVQKYTAGDKMGARTAAAGAGDAETLAALDKLDAAQAAEAKQRAEGMFAALSDVQKLPYEQRKAKLAEIAPNAAQFGLKPEEVLAFDPTDSNNTSLMIKALGMSAYLERKDKLSKPIEIDPTKSLYLPDDGSAPPPAASAAPAQPSPEGPGAAPAPDAVWANMKHREVQNGDGNAVSEQGAIGSTQMLPATAEAMARKAGLPWRPDMMRGNSPQALAYQDTLGRAYFDEGLQRYGGDLYKAASYYHGGPDERQWGPKTRAYAEAVTRGAQGDAQPYEVAANGPTPPPPSIPGYRLVQQGRQPWQSDGKGGLVNVATGDRKADPTSQSSRATVRAATTEEKAARGIPADVPAQIDDKTGRIDVISGVGARAKAVPSKITEGYIANQTVLSAIDKAIALLKGHPNAMGVRNVLGDDIRQRTDVDGIQTRAAVAKIGAVKLHDLSGAAITAAETPRLKPFIPMPTDTAEAAIKKLESLREEAANNNSQIEVAFGEHNGYAPFGGPPSAPPATTKPPPSRAQQPSTTKAAPRPGSVVRGYRFKGGDPANPKSWAKV